ncbi:MAG: hypothetical protein WCA85_15455 [Paraburkholderia sp.]|uniref:hypothetical protein n=1 Tax=Paraburkholderia sp. TaxID=1926495 RepID=UPI003C44A28E
MTKTIAPSALAFSRGTQQSQLADAGSLLEEGDKCRKRPLATKGFSRTSWILSVNAPPSTVGEL